MNICGPKAGVSLWNLAIEREKEKTRVFLFHKTKFMTFWYQTQVSLFNGPRFFWNGIKKGSFTGDVWIRKIQQVSMKLIRWKRITKVTQPSNRYQNLPDDFRISFLMKSLLNIFPARFMFMRKLEKKDLVSFGEKCLTAKSHDHKKSNHRRQTFISIIHFYGIYKFCFQSKENC